MIIKDKQPEQSSLLGSFTVTMRREDGKIHIQQQFKQDEYALAIKEYNRLIENYAYDTPTYTYSIETVIVSNI